VDEDDAELSALVGEYAEATQEVFHARDRLRAYLRDHSTDAELARRTELLFDAVTRLVRAEARITRSHLEFIRQLREQDEEDEPERG
jgi:hypothetical protein